MDPFTIAALGLGTVGSAVGGIQQALTADDRKKEFLRKQQQQAQMLAARHSRMSDFYGEQPIDFWGDNARAAKLNKRDAQNYAEENFKVDPASFLPFVQNATQLGGAIYDAAGGGGPKKADTRPPAAADLQYFDYDPNDRWGGYV